MDLQNRMIIRLYAPPTLLLISSSIVLYITPIISDRLAISQAFTPLSQLVIRGGFWLAVGLFTSSILIVTYNTYRLWKWNKGDEQQVCHKCSGMVSEKHGRYGTYYRCLACRATHSSD